MRFEYKSIKQQRLNGFYIEHDNNMKYQWHTIEHISYADINNCINSTILRSYQLCARDIMDTNAAKL